MSDLKKLAKRLMTLDDRIIACMKCGMCQAVCPMFGATMMEADVARGKLALVDNLAHEMIADPEAVADKLGRCLLCGSCEANCPSGVKIMDIFMEAREIVNTYLGLHPVKKMVFRALLPYPGLFNFAMRVGAPMQRVIFRSNKDTQNTACAPMLNFMLGDRHIRSLALKPLHAIYGNLDEPRVMGGLKVAFFPGCMGDKLYVDVSEACIKVLHHHNVAIYMPSSFACCGIPALSSGDAEGMVKQMAKSLAADYAPFGVTVNCVAPSMMETRFLADTSDLIVQASAEANPMGRNARPSDVVPAMAFLLSDEAGFITGQVIAPNGGLVI